MILGSTHRIIFNPARQTQPNLLLNKYGEAAAAYSLRLLDNQYDGPAINVRHTGEGNPSKLIYFINGELDTETIINFCGNHNGYVTRWYDQSGNNNDLTQTTAANQPQIYDRNEGVIFQNGKPSINFAGAGHLLTSDTGINTPIEQIQTVTYIDSQITATSPLQQLLNTYGGAGFEGIATGAATGSLTNETFTILNNAGAREAITDIINIGLHLFTIDWNGNNHNIYLNSNEGNYISINTPIQLNSRNISIGARFESPFFYFGGQVQEVIFYNTDQSSNRTGIQNNINQYYKIY